MLWEEVEMLSLLRRSSSDWTADTLWQVQVLGLPRWSPVRCRIGAGFRQAGRSKILISFAAFGGSVGVLRRLFSAVSWGKWGEKVNRIRTKNSTYFQRCDQPGPILALELPWGVSGLAPRKEGSSSCCVLALVS